MLMETLFRHGKAITAFVIIAILVLIGYFAYISIDRNGKIPIIINAVPDDATITLNDKGVGVGTSYVTPGSYNIKASKEGFADFSTTIYLDQKNQTVTIPMVADSQEALTWVDNNQDLYMELEGKAGEAANKSGEAFRDKNPIVNILPYNNLLYTIGYRNDDSDPTGNSIIIEIDAPEGYRQAALYQIKQWGYDPTDFKINFNNYQNPFTS